MSVIKCVFLGPAHSGKTQTIHRILGKPLVDDYNPTSGVVVRPVDVKIPDVETLPHLPYSSDLENVTVNVWDTAGNKAREGLRDAYYIEAECAVVFYRTDSDVVKRYRDFTRVIDSRIPLCLVAREEDRENRDFIKLYQAMNKNWPSMRVIDPYDYTKILPQLAKEALGYY